MTNNTHENLTADEQLARIGCPAQKIKETVANRKLCQQLVALMRQASFLFLYKISIEIHAYEVKNQLDWPQCDWTRGFPLYELATLVAAQQKSGGTETAESLAAAPAVAYVLDRWRDGSLQNKEQVAGTH